jgi:branched-chain amino acid transport system permease protein
MSYLLHLLIFFQIYAVVAMSLNLLIGYGGLLQVAHAAYFGVGAYTAALLWTKLGVGFIPGLLGAALMSSLLSLLVSLSAWRFRGDYFVMISLAVQVVLYSLMYNFMDITNGPYGITAIPKPVIMNSTSATQMATFAIYVVVVGMLALILAAAKLSPFGRSLQAMRDDELAARSLGIPVRRLKVEAFMLASAMVGVAGGLYASYISYIDPTSFTLDESILMLSMVIVGGTGNVRGPLVGAAVLIAIPELLRFLSLPDTVAAHIRLLAYGLLLILMMHWRPQGLAGRYRFE